MEFEAIDDSGNQNTIALDRLDGSDVFVRASTYISLSVGTGRGKADVAVLEDCDKEPIIGRQVKDALAAASRLGKVITSDVFRNFNGESRSSVDIDNWDTGIRVKKLLDVTN